MKLSQKSAEKLSTCHPDLQVIFNEAIKNSIIDFGISEGKRTDEKQLEYFLAGNSRIDPRNPKLKKKGKHLRSPSEAVDIYVWVPNRKDLAFDKVHLAFIAGHIIETSRRLFDAGLICHKLRWGGNWDSDGTLLYDQTLMDMPHFEIV